MVSANQGVDIPLSGLCVQIHTIFCKSTFFFFGFSCFTCQNLFVIFSANDWSTLNKIWILCHTMSNKIYCIITGHILFLKEERRITFAFSKDGYQNISACDLCPSRGLYMDCCTLHHSLECCRGYGF